MKSLYVKYAISLSSLIGIILLGGCAALTEDLVLGAIDGQAHPEHLEST